MTAHRALGVAILTTGLALTLGGCRYRARLASRGYERQKTTSGPDKHRGYESDD